MKVFRCLKLAYEAAEAGRHLSGCDERANEELVALFLKGKFILPTSKKHRKKYLMTINLHII